jgi:hypothetical protein
MMAITDDVPVCQHYTGGDLLNQHQDNTETVWVRPRWPLSLAWRFVAPMTSIWPLPARRMHLRCGEICGGHTARTSLY